MIGLINLKTIIFYMSVLENKLAPEFKTTAVMPDGSEKEVSLSDYKGKYVVLFFYPKDFTFV